MKQSLRYLVLSGALLLMAAPVFADGPGGNDPPPPNSAAVNVTGASNGTPAAVIEALLLYLGL